MRVVTKQLSPPSRGLWGVARKSSPGAHLVESLIDKEVLGNTTDFAELGAVSKPTTPHRSTAS